MITLPNIYSDLQADEFMSDDDVMTLVYHDHGDEDDDCDGQLEFEWDDDDLGDDDDDDYYEDDDDLL